MSFSVNQFRDHFSKHNDFAKTSKFDVRITAPTGLGLDASDLRFQCEATELPGYSVSTVDSRYYGVPSPVASFAAFTDLTLTFICAGDFWEKKLFDRWMNLVIPINNYNPNYKDTYISPKITINQFSEIAGKNNTAPVIYNVSLFEAFPSAIAPMSMNWADDGIHRLAVTFKYEYWTTGELEQVARPNPNIPSTVRPATASGSLPLVVDGKPTTVPQRTPAIAFKDNAGSFAGYGTSGR